MKEFFIQLWEVTTGGTIYNLIILILAIVGLVLSYYFYRKSTRHSSATYAVRTINLIAQGAKKLSGIDVMYGLDSVRSLSISKIALWNSGSDTINADSIAKNNTLRVEAASGVEILGADILFEKNPSNDFCITLEDDRHTLQIDFDYFDRDEGVVIQLYHTGRNSSDVAVVGQIKACQKIRRIKPYATAPMPMPDFKHVESIRVNDREFRISSYKAMVIYGWIIMAIALVTSFLRLREIWHTPDETIVKDPFMESLWVICLGFIYGLVGYQVVRRRIPKGFDIFNEEF